MKRAFNILLAMFVSLVTTQLGYAGDTAQRDLIGYSNDGRYFAFEEYGIQDGSGFAYTNIFVIDTANDKWVKGSPVRLRADDETTSLRSIRNKARTTYRQKFGRPLKIHVPAITIAAQGLGEPDVPETDRLIFALPTYATQMQPGDRFPTDVEVELELRHKRLPTSNAICQDMLGDDPYGLELWASIDGASPTLIHADKRVPSSRGCVMAYQISEVVVPFGAQDIKDAIALLSIYAFGFEGPDRRFLAAPLHLN